MENAVPPRFDGNKIRCGTGEILVRRDGVGDIGAVARETWPGVARVFVITDSNVAAAALPAVERSFAASGIAAHSRAVPAGEESKSIAAAGRLCEWLASHRAERGEPVIALGGGVVGDLAGFVAATYLRGVPLMQVPTTLLAMVDSSVGGKTGVNLEAGKNLVGAFYPPSIVLVDPVLLGSLPARELRSGWAEVVKYAFLEASVPRSGPAILHDLLRRDGDSLRALEPRATDRVIARCIELKALVVTLDERESGPRRMLNLGHTIGHAIEAESGYGSYAHGEAVALGLRAVAQLGHRLGSCGPEVPARVDELLLAFGLPRTLRDLRASALVARTKADKKSTAGRVTWVVPTGLDTVEFSREVPDELVLDTLVSMGAASG